MSGMDNIPFPLKLYHLLELFSPTTQTETQDVSNPAIGWHKHGKSFCIFNPKKFEEEVIPKYFKHKHKASFQRQLNIYGFHKVSIIDELRGSYYNPSFQRGRVDLLASIYRNVKENNISKLDNQKLSESAWISIHSQSSCSTAGSEGQLTKKQKSSQYREYLTSFSVSADSLSRDDSSMVTLNTAYENSFTIQSNSFDESFTHNSEENLYSRRYSFPSTTTNVLSSQKTSGSSSTNNFHKKVIEEAFVNPPADDTISNGFVVKKRPYESISSVSSSYEQQSLYKQLPLSILNRAEYLNDKISSSPQESFSNIYQRTIMEMDITDTNPIDSFKSKNTDAPVILSQDPTTQHNELLYFQTDEYIPFTNIGSTFSSSIWSESTTCQSSKSNISQSYYGFEWGIFDKYDQISETTVIDSDLITINKIAETEVGNFSSYADFDDLNF